MSVSNWFRSRSAQKKDENLWTKCQSCGAILYQPDLEEKWYVCPECQFHYHLPAYLRIALLVDNEKNGFVELNQELEPVDPLNFNGVKPYKESLKQAQATTGLKEAALTGIGQINGQNVALGVLDFNFIGGSMGSVVGRKIANLFHEATRQNLPVITVSSSGGARMQEGIFSLMQMAKTAAAVQRFSATNRPYISVLAHPTTGGVLASFSSLADIIIAEPQALIGFAGPRVIEQTLNQKVPKGFQNAEAVLKNGFIDLLVPRKELRAVLINLLNYLC